MELVWLGVFFLVLYLVVRFLTKGMSGLSRIRHKAYRQLAQRYRGKYEPRGLVDPPTVSFPHAGSLVRVGLAPVVPNQPATPRTRVVARFAQGLPLRLELMPMGRPQPPQAPKGTRPVKLGQNDFDRAWVVQANDPEITRELFGRIEARTAIENLRRMAPPSGMLLSINPERLLTQVDRNLGAQTATLDAIVRETLLLHDAIVASVAARVSEGIAIVAPGTPGIGDDADAEPKEVICEVCGEPVVASHVACVACKTPYHRDCWTFIGGCSTYGCPSKQCVAAEFAPAASRENQG
jgi:hypothetical protein